MITVERATEEDFDDICAIDQAHSDNRDRRAWLAERIRLRECLIAREGTLKLGFAIVNRHFFGEYFVDLLMVHPNYRRRGVGSALINYAAKTCPEPKIFTSTNQSNITMQALCESLGFIKSGYIENLDEGDPEIIYVKLLGDK